MRGLLAALQSGFGGLKPRVCSIGGSGTWGLPFPEDLPGRSGEAGVAARIEDGVETPFGRTVGLKVLSVRGQPVLRVAMHAHHSPPSLRDSHQLFWVLRELGVERVVVDASVGGLSFAGEPVEPWDAVICDDFVDVHSKESAAEFAQALGLPAWKRMKQPFCPEVRGALAAAAARVADEAAGLGVHPLGRVLDQGVYYTTPIGPFETAVEIRAYEAIGATVVGQTTGIEAYLARLCGMCFAGLYVASNRAEGLGGPEGDWVRGGMKAFYEQCGPPMGLAIWHALEDLVERPRACDCARIAAENELSGFPVKGA